MQHRRPRALLCVVLALLAAAVLALPSPALALTTNKATAKPNAASGGNEVLGGLNTRLTWEGTVDADESLSQLTLAGPSQDTFAGASTTVTVLDGLTRIPTEATSVVLDGNLAITFAQAIPENSLVRVEATDMRFPAEGGEFSIGGTYTTTDGASHELTASAPIVVVANTPLQQFVDWLDAQPWVQAWNSVPFLNMFFKPQLIVTSMSKLFPGWLLCLAIVLCSYPFAILLGLVFAFMRISRHTLLRGIASVYVNLLRGTPQFLQIYIAFFGLPMVGVNINNNLLGGIVVAINSSAYLAEIFRAGIQSIPPGQYEAAESLGMSHMQTMISIILPQTIRRVIPTVVSDFITNYKDTSLLSSVGVMELMMFAKNLTAINGNITPYMAAAIYYLLVTLPLVKVLGIVEKRLANSERGTRKRVRGGGDASSDASDQDLLTAAASSGAAGMLAEGHAPEALPVTFVPALGGAADVR